MAIENIELKIGEFTFDGFATGPSDGPLVICLHGFPQFADSWLKILPALGAAGFRAVALNQRGYAKGAQPSRVSDYALPILVNDVLSFATELGATKFHLIGHDWGGIVGWKLAADFPERLLSVNILSTPHLDAFREALLTSLDQAKKSSYIALFKAPFHLAEKALMANNAKMLREAYEGKVDFVQVEENVKRFTDGRTLTNALNWYRALKMKGRMGMIEVPTLYAWSSEDRALGLKAAANTAKFVRAPYRFERFEGASHWLPDEKSDALSEILVSNMSTHNESHA